MLTQSKSTVLAIANATELISGIVYSICGNEVANTINGTPVNQDVLRQLVATQVHAKFSTYTAKASQ